MQQRTMVSGSLVLTPMHWQVTGMGQDKKLFDSDSLTTNEKFGSFSSLIIRVMKGNNLEMQMKYK